MNITADQLERWARMAGSRNVLGQELHELYVKAVLEESQPKPECTGTIVHPEHGVFCPVHKKG